MPVFGAMTAAAKPAWSNAVVTGAAGFIGSHLVRVLRRQGLEVTAIDRWSGAGTDIVEIDLAQPGSLDGLLGPETALFHLAGSADVQRSVQEPVADFRDNVVAMIEVLEAVRRVGCAVLLLPSTGSVYDAAGPHPFRETSPTRPSSPYAAAKIACEAYCLAYARSYGIDVRIARLFSVFGPGMRRFAIHDFYQKLQRESHHLTLRGDGGQTRDYLYVDDAARALAMIAAAGARGEIYNVASGEPRSMRDVASAVSRAMGFNDCQIAPDGAVISAEVYRMEADPGRLQRLGFLPETTFEDGLLRTIAWFRQAS